MAALEKRELERAQSSLFSFEKTAPSSEKNCVSFLKAYLSFLQKKLPYAGALLKTIPAIGPYYAFASLQYHLQNNEEEEDFLFLLKREKAFFHKYPVLFELKANALLQLNRLEEAKSLLLYAQKYISPRPSRFLIFISILIQKGDFSEAETLLKDHLHITPNDPLALSSLASIYNIFNKTEEALTLFRRAITITPNDANLRLNHSIALLKAKRYAQGWYEHEWRFRLPNHTSFPQEEILPSLAPLTPDKPLPLEGKKILIPHEEGLGDTLMYLRYLPILAEYGCALHIWGSEELASLSRRVEGVDYVQVGGTAPSYDYHCPFISLPRVFHHHPKFSMGAKIPYLSASPEKITFWKEKLPPKSPHKFRIGLVWAGGSHTENRAARLMNYQRSASLKIFEPLLSLPKCSFYSLQKGTAASELKELQKDPNSLTHKIIDLMPECAIMEDTAALITQLDLVISVDTSLIHLAGGLGKKTFLLNRFTGCWRWGHDEKESPWYPTLTIFKQKEFGNWHHPIEEIKHALEEILHHLP